METSPHPELLNFFKALADETRLKMVGLLAREPHTGEQLAAALDLKPATISHHLGKLLEAGLVAVEAQRGHAKPYRLRLNAIHQLAERLLQTDTLPKLAAHTEASYDAEVKRNFLAADGTLKSLPAAEKKFKVILRHLAEAFEMGRAYPEKEVNAILARYHPDTASLRRGFIEHQLFTRAHGVYQRVAAPPTLPA